MIKFAVSKFAYNDFYRSQFPNVFYLDADHVKWFILNVKPSGARFEVILWEESTNSEVVEIFNGDEPVFIDYNEVAYNDF